MLFKQTRTLLIAGMITGLLVQGCSREELLKAIADEVFTYGPPVVEVDLFVSGDRVAPGYPILIEVDWSAPCYKGGRCDWQPFALEVDCGAIPCEVERVYADDESPEGAPFSSSVGLMQLQVRPGAPGPLPLRVILTHHDTREQERISLRPLIVAQPAELGFVCRDEPWQPCPDSILLGEMVDLGVWARTAEGAYLAVDPRITFNGEPWADADVLCFNSQEVFFTPGEISDPYLCQVTGRVPGELVIEASLDGLTATQTLWVGPH